jgi:FemAB-related protein (PEP-CTERM system-associated)
MSSLLKELKRLTLTAQPFTDDSAAWDRFVHAEKTSTFCHLAGWRDILCDVFGLESRYEIALDENGTWCGVLPLVRMKSRMLGHHLISLPYLNYGGALGTAEARRYLVTRALEETRVSRADTLELRDRLDVATVPEMTPGRPKITVLLDLPPDSTELWEKQFNAKLRSQIRRPQKDGMQAQMGHAHLGAFYEVFSRNMRDLGTPVLPRRFFERLPQVFGERVVFGAVYQGDTPVAAGCGFIWRNEFEMTWASALREYNRSAPNMMLYWCFMEAMIARGVRGFNFGRCTPDGGTHRFKKQWQGRDIPLSWMQWTRKPTVDTSAEPSRALRVASAAWQRLPLPIANRIGPMVARRLSQY